MSMTIAVNVFIKLSASAPASIAARAITLMSVTEGDSFTINTLSLAAFLTADVISVTIFGSVPKLIPPFSTLGQLIFSSNPVIAFSVASRSTTATYSPIVSPATLTKTAGLMFSRRGNFSSMNLFSPILAKPIALSMPQSVSTILGVGLPFRGFRVMLLVMNPPSEFISIKSLSSSAYPHVPEAVNTGFAIRIPAKSTEISTCSLT